MEAANVSDCTVANGGLTANSNLKKHDAEGQFVVDLRD
jgi:hypothetical protein